jgi:hypothetical protein
MNSYLWSMARLGVMPRIEAQKGRHIAQKRQIFSSINRFRLSLGRPHFFGPVSMKPIISAKISWTARTCVSVTAGSRHFVICCWHINKGDNNRFTCWRPGKCLAGSHLYFSRAHVRSSASANIIIRRAAAHWHVFFARAGFCSRTVAIVFENMLTSPLRRDDASVFLCARDGLGFPKTVACYFLDHGPSPSHFGKSLAFCGSGA